MSWRTEVAESVDPNPCVTSRAYTGGTHQERQMKQHGTIAGFVGPVFALLVGAAAWAQAPDPATVVREGAGYKYPQAGWWVVHVEGAPYERGVQHGKLLAEEIAGYL